MAVVFQSRADGYRVAKLDGSQQMLASLHTKRQVDTGNQEWTQLLEAKLKGFSGEDPAVVETLRKQLLATGPTFYAPIPQDEWTMQLCNPISLGDLKDILANLPTEA